jgi:type I restriction enzyme S subunit
MPLKNFGHYIVVCPPVELQEQFELVVSGLSARQYAASIESEIVADIRDSLLPRLVSGEVRVPQGFDVEGCVV